MATRRRTITELYQELTTMLNALEDYYNDLTDDEQQIYNDCWSLLNEYIANDNTSSRAMNGDLRRLFPRLLRIYNRYINSENVDPNIPTTGTGIRKKKHLVKGSREAKAHMKYLRSLKSA